MSKNEDKLEKTSRRDFTGMAVTAALAASLAACKNGSSGSTNQASGVTQASDTPCPAKVEKRGSQTSLLFDTQDRQIFTDHIPPMIFEGRGSLLIDFKWSLNESGSGTGPYTYTEADVPTGGDKYGQIHGAVIIAETDRMPLIRTEGPFPADTQLRLYYQPLKVTPSSPDPDEIEYGSTNSDPDVIVKGGKTNEPCSIWVRQKRLERNIKSHKAPQPKSAKHSNDNGARKHFRIGKWAFVNQDATTTYAWDEGHHNYIIYVNFDHHH